MPEPAAESTPPRRFSYVTRVALPFDAALLSPLDWHRTKETVAWAPVGPISVRALEDKRGLVDRIALRRISNTQTRVRLGGLLDDGVHGDPICQPAFTRRLQGVISLRVADGGALDFRSDDLFAEPLPGEVSAVFRPEGGRAVHLFIPGYSTHSVLGRPLPITRCGERVYWNTCHFVPLALDAVDCGRCVTFVIGDMTRLRSRGHADGQDRGAEGPGRGAEGRGSGAAGVG